MKSLDSIGIEVGTDKSRLRQDYLRSFERIMSPFLGKAIILLEIGLHNGASLKMWEKYFPLASIVGVDIEPTTKRFTRERVKIEIGSQFDGEFLAHLTAKYSPDIVIDDGSHIDAHQIFTFEAMFPSVAPGGLYVVEDIAHSTRPGSAADYFCILQRDILLGQGSVSVACVETIPRAVAIWKASRDELDGNFDELEIAAAASDLPSESLFYLSEYIRRNGPLNRALAVAQRASAADPINGWIVLEISRILSLIGDLPAAVEAARRASELVNQMSGHIPPAFSEHLDRLRMDSE